VHVMWFNRERIISPWSSSCKQLEK
jgi:hypothetical protein